MQTEEGWNRVVSQVPNLMCYFCGEEPNQKEEPDHKTDISNRIAEGPSDGLWTIV